MANLVICLLFPLFVVSQANQYVFLQTEVDARNALFGGTVNEVGYNGVFKAGFNAQWFRADVFYETFAILNYQSAGVNLSSMFRYNKALQPGVGVQFSLIDKPKRLTPSLGLNAMLEYHLGRFFVSARAETKLRTDWDITVHSGFLGLGYKFYSRDKYGNFKN